MRLEGCEVSHSFESLEVLQSIDLSAEEGEVLAGIGPSGCGKSTLLSILGGLLEPTSGKVLVSGESPPGCLNELTYVFQDFALLPWRTVEGNVALPLEAATLSPAEKKERVGEALLKTDLSSFADAFPRQLSGGMQQRVGIARALVVHPAVLLMDEPLSALDAQTRELLKDDLLRLWSDTGCTTVYVTHNLGEAVTLADRVVVLSRRPATVRAIIEVPGVRGERQRGDEASAAVEAEIWNLLRAEAEDADRAVVEVSR